MAFKMNDGNDDQGHIVDINVVPLVDVMLVLLIIFMVTAPLSIGGIGVELPSSRARTAGVDQERVILSITQSGEFYLDKTAIPAAQLDKKLKALFEFRDKKEIYIRADRGVPYGRVVDAMTAAKLAGVTRMAMLTKNDGRKQ